MRSKPLVRSTMPRYIVILKLPGGGSAIIHGSKPMQACACGMEVSAWLCDYELSPGRTCDRRMGPNCRTNVGPDVDYCPDHKS